MYKYRLKFECLKPGSVYGLGGSECHGLFFSMLDKLSSHSHILHDAKQNPYSLGPISGKGKREKGKFNLYTGTEYSFTLSALTEDMNGVAAKLKSMVQPAHQFRLGSADCRWIGVDMVAEARYQDLLDCKPVSNLSLSFSSPASFRSQGISLLFPEPELVFGSLQQRWNAVAPIPIDVNSQCLYISRYNLRTSYIRFAKYNMTGFQGKVEYRFSKHADQIQRQRILALAKFAQFSGIGYKTGMGMGQVILSN